jgi:hypothetical protein
MEKLEATKGVVRCRQSKERQCNGQKKKDKMIDLQNNKETFKDCNRNSTIDVVHSGAPEG